MVNKKWKFIIPLALLLILGTSTTAYAHGAKIDYTVNMTIDIVAKYDTGEPMGGAQVVVYAPDDPSNPWLTGVCDDEGRYSFTPDTSMPGTWSIQVRQSGHGDIVHIPIGEDTAVTGSAGGYTVLQIVLMAVCGIWGFVGTALYFSRRRA
jgi:nickel transport protein